MVYNNYILLRIQPHADYYNNMTFSMVRGLKLVLIVIIADGTHGA